MIYSRKKLIIIITIIFIMLFVSSCKNVMKTEEEKTEKLDTLCDLSVDNIKKITFSTQMEDIQTGTIVIDEMNEISSILEVLKEIEYKSNELQNDSNGWLFMLNVEYKNNDKMIISLSKKNLCINGKYHETTTDVSKKLFEVYKTLTK